MAKKVTVASKKDKNHVETIEIKSSKSGHRPKITVLVDSEEALERQVHGFVGFLRERAIVALAVGFVVATQAQNLIKQLLASFLDPLTKIFFGSRLSDQTFTWTYHGRSQNFAWGEFVYVLINFFVVILTLYIIIKLFKLDKLDKPAESKK